MANRQNQGANYAPTEAGLPRADDYAPEKIGTAELKAGTAEQTFPEYGLEMVPVVMDNEDTGVRLIRRNGSYISQVKDGYSLLPNERAVEVANDVASDLGAVPFHQWGDDDADWYARLQDHVYQDHERRRVHALYAWGDKVDIGGGDTVSFGFAVHNSIDASLSFQVGLFSFRHACANMVTMAVKDTQANTFQTGRFDARDVEAEREVLAHSAQKHTSGLDIDREALKARIETTLMAVDPELSGEMDGAIPEAYRQWRDEHVTPDVVDPLIDLVEKNRLAADDVPAWVIEAQENVAEFTEHDTDALAEAGTPFEWIGEGTQVSDVIAASIPESETLWSLYNSVTESIWHEDNSDQTKDRKFRALHGAIQPAAGVR